jgi:Maltose operon periplasmic protein precursor (MalM)
VQGFTIPARTGSIMISVTSSQLGTMLDSAIFYPDTRLLDASFRVIRSVPAESYAYRVDTEGATLSTSFFLNEPSGAERYLVIASRRLADAELVISQSNITTTTMVAVPFPGGAAMWSVPTGTNTAPKKLIASPVGKLKVS